MALHITCIFPTCSNPVQYGSDKCNLHKRRSQCKMPGCPNQVYARQLCIRHGAKHECMMPDCHGNVRSGGLCARHAPPTIRKCSQAGCANVAHQRGKCVRHGGRRQCLVQGCETHARKGGYCCRHRRNAAAAAVDLVTKLEPVDFWGDLVNNFQDDIDIDPSLIEVIKVEFDNVQVIPSDWELVHSILNNTI
ncbi:hypothetical protein LEN26_017038 [Aphanomyces euteiches]|nr:hypothetical protein LEN26_017038 [Aphanomyces euteiches]KAH9114261.1 hypothetical protein AeMF1_011633 [Aphanomyces euteiches]KAH9185833.1 hypothetical protein AeNC1_012190 [Aphanomyces euteiches]